MTNLVESVWNLVIHHPNLLPGADNELRELMDDLNSLKALFREMAQKQKDEGAFREMERQIKEVIYDVEDTINACLTKAKTNKSFLSSTRNHAPISATLTLSLSRLHARKLAKQVKKLRETKVMPMLEAFKAEILTLTFSYTWAEQHRTEARKVNHTILFFVVVYYY